MSYRGKRVGVILGGLSAEREISLRTGKGVIEALRGRGYDVAPIDWQAQGDLPRQIAEAKIEVAWLALHGIFGEDGCVQGLLECLRIPYTGSGVVGSALALDKVMSKRIFEDVGVPTPRWRIYEAPSDATAIGYPVVVKPAKDGSSVGVTIVRAPGDLGRAVEEAKRHPGDVLVEEYIHGREVTVGILGGKTIGDAEVRPAVEFYDYQAKYHRSDTQYICPADLPEAVHTRVATLAEAAHRALQCQGYSRVDFMLDGERALCLEVNSLPGLTDKSLLPKIAAARGIDYGALVERILDAASLKV